MTTSTTGAPARLEPRLLGQTVVVIGGSAGIGLETARRARDEGADVVLAARNPASLQSFFRDLPTPIDHLMVTGGGLPPALRRGQRLKLN